MTRHPHGRGTALVVDIVAAVLTAVLLFDLRVSLREACKSHVVRRPGGEAHGRLRSM